MRGGPYPPVAVQPNASDIFYAVAVGVVESVGNSCGDAHHCYFLTDLNPTPKTLQNPVKVLNPKISLCRMSSSPDNSADLGDIRADISLWCQGGLSISMSWVLSPVLVGSVLSVNVIAACIATV